MPRIKRWFHVSHDINSDGEVWELTDRFGVAGLRVWLELLSIADRNDGSLPDLSDSTIRQLSIKCNSTKSRVRLVLDFTMTKRWVVCDPSARVRNWLSYNPLREAKKSQTVSPPNLPNHPNLPIEDKILAPRQKSVAAPTPWPPEDEWLRKLISEQTIFAHAIVQLTDFAWWEDVAAAINGIDPGFIQPEFAKMSAWVRENPGRKPTAKGCRRFVRSWLERAREQQRRLYAVKK